jgi:arylsulfatase A-like enzyme
MKMNETNQNHGFDLVSTPSADLTGQGTFLPYDEVHPGRSVVGETALTNDEHKTGQIAAESIQFIRDNRDKAFVLWCSFWGPHTPITPSAPWSTQYDPNNLTLPPNLHVIDQQMPGVDTLLSKSGTYPEDFYHSATLGYYYGLVSQIDYNIGRILDELDDLGLTDNTIVVYTADHGEMMAEHGAWTKGKTAYEAQIRIPFILSFPGLFTKEKKSSELVGSIDLLPTLLDAANLKIPDNIDGSSLLPLIQGKVKKWRDYMFSEHGSSSNTTQIMTRSKTHKYVLFRTAGLTEHEQLFDMQADPWEMNNLIDDAGYADVLTELKNALATWETDTPPAVPMDAS